MPTVRAERHCILQCEGQKSSKDLDTIKVKKERLIKIIHESPRAYDINRASWSIQALADAYYRTYSERISASSISEYFISAGYKFKKAKKVLTSDDRTYRDKLAKITSALSHLMTREKVFSIDEFGPFSVKIRGGVALVPGDEIRTIPQRQKSKGSLICTAALEPLNQSSDSLLFQEKEYGRDAQAATAFWLRFTKAKIACSSLGIRHRGMPPSLFIRPLMKSTVRHLGSVTKRLLLSSCRCHLGLNS